MADKDKQDTVYDTRTLSKWFALGSIVLLIVTVWASIQDYARPWKVYQRQYQAISAAVGERKLMQAEKAMSQSKLQELEKQIADAQAGMALVTKDVDKKIAKIQDRLYIATSKYQIAKGELDAHNYVLEHAVEKTPAKVAKIKADFDKEKAHVGELRLIQEQLEIALAQAEADKRDILSTEKKATEELSKLLFQQNALKKQIAANEASIGNLARNAPIVDFVAPTIKVNQIILDGLYDDYFFNKVQRVDRCMTCHVTADKAGFEDYPQPFKTHPKLHLIVGADSPHPVEKMGCTVCHAGAPGSVDFNHAAHTPRNEEQALEWEEKYHFHYNAHVKTPMIPLQLTEGRCIQCHAKEVQLKDAPTFNAGMRLIERYGCYNCHKFGGHFDQLSKERKSGPSLQHLASKLNQDWVRKWLWDPKSFRPSTLMPAFWQTHNNSDPDSLERGKVEVDAIAHFIFKKSKPYEPIKLASGAQGDIERGKAIVGSVGCLGCHASADFPRTNPEDPTALGWKDPRVPMFGPELNQMGSKVSAAWLESWLINPKHYWEGTMMPSMKLKEQEAKDVAAYLLSKKNSDFDQARVPKPKDEVRDAVTLEFLKGQMATNDANVKLASMSLEDKRSYLGEKLVSHYGCYACHAIDGFEKAPNIGAELTLEGSKDVSKFDFGNVHLVKTQREQWIYTKIRTPRIWDVGKNRDFQGKVRMPHFGMGHEQAEAITAIVIGYEIDKVDDGKKHKIDGRWESIIAGHRIVNRQNCVGCHGIELQGGHVLAHYEDPSEGPPNLNTQGRKTQSDWLFSYLKNTDVMIRPWVKARMPQFGFDDATAVAITRYFAAVDNAQYPSFASRKGNPLTAEEQQQAVKLMDQLVCLSCHGVRKPGEDVASAAPHFANVKHRLQSDWIAHHWLPDPAGIMPGTRMPQNWPLNDPEDVSQGNLAIPGYFGDDAKTQMEKVTDYLMVYPGEVSLPPPAR
jgi:cbb3-type cytochrome oxidase cytochrome c subunit